MQTDLGGISEVVECGAREANHYLDASYVLLAIVHATRPSVRPDKQHYTRHDAKYVLGRPHLVTRVEPLARPTPARPAAR